MHAEQELLNPKGYKMKYTRHHNSTQAKSTDQPQRLSKSQHIAFLDAISKDVRLSRSAAAGWVENAFTSNGIGYPRMEWCFRAPDAGFCYKSQHVIEGRIGRPWRTRRVNRSARR
jgi:hypothetical protein